MLILFFYVLHQLISSSQAICECDESSLTTQLKTNENEWTAFTSAADIVLWFLWYIIEILIFLLISLRSALTNISIITTKLYLGDKKIGILIT